MANTGPNKTGEQSRTDNPPGPGQASPTSKEKFRILFELSAIATVYTDLDGTIRAVNRRFMHLHGLSGEPDDLVGRNVGEFFPERERARLRERIETTIHAGGMLEPVEYTMQRDDGSLFQAEASSSVITDPDGEPVALLAYALDLTDRRRAEQRLSRILASISEIVFETDAAANLLFVNEAGYRITGYSAEDLARGINVIDMLDPGDHERARANIGRILQGEDIGPSEYTLYTKAGEQLPVLIHSIPFAATDGSTGLLGVIVDISRHRAAEEEQRRIAEALRVERDRIRTILDLVGDIVLVLERDGTVGVINRQGCEILECDEEEIVDRNWFEHFLPADIREEVSSIFSRLIAGEIELAREHENPVLTASGAERLIAWRNSVLYDEEGRVLRVISSGTDITERRDLEQQLQQAQKMEAIGRLAGGIAHDFNNLLTVISGSVEMARREQDLATLQARIDAIGKAAKAASDLTSQLLTFSSRQTARPELTRLGRAVDDSLKILERTLGEDISLIVEHDPSQLPVMIDPAHLSQILMNLILNARDAMPAGGKLTITTAPVELEADRLAAREDLEPGSYARLTVSDSGTGMSEEHQARLFDPFFTTKEPGQGTGLGMATVYGIVIQNRGLIEVESNPGAGTTIMVFLPIVSAEVLPEPVSETSSSVTGGSERIMVVEDETAVRELVVEILTQMGYSVTAHADPAGAIAALQTLPEADRPDLLISDVVMPGMSGIEMVETIEELIGPMPVLFMSGYTDDALARRGLNEQKREIVSKPFSTFDLCNRVRTLLNR